jgi:hypothetical protein
MKAPKGWHGPAQALWEKGQSNEAIQACVNAVNELSKKQQRSARLFDQLSYYLFVKGQFPSALTMLEESNRLDPENIETLRHLSVVSKRLGKNAKSVGWAKKALALAPDDFVSLDTLAHGLHRLKRDDEARAAGTRSLVLKDRVAVQAAPAQPKWKLPATRPSAGQRQIGELPNVMAFSLWGAQPRYLRGALRNVLEAPKVFPGWTLRFYVDNSVPSDFLNLLREHGAQVKRYTGSETASLRQRLAWRFLVANDAGVGYFLCRDADSVISAREALAVSAWLDGGAHFHVIRDWWSHTDLMLAGMWGGVAGVLPSIEAMMRRYQSPAMETANIDQWFLRDRVWPLVRHSVCVHDRLFTMPGAQPVPGEALPFGSNQHIGQNEFSVHADAQAQALRPWLDRYPWL